MLNQTFETVLNLPFLQCTETGNELRIRTGRICHGMCSLKCFFLLQVSLKRTGFSGLILRGPHVPLFSLVVWSHYRVLYFTKNKGSDPHRGHSKIESNHLQRTNVCFVFVSNIFIGTNLLDAFPSRTTSTPFFEKTNVLISQAIWVIFW